MKIRLDLRIILLSVMLFATTETAIYAQGWLHPGIDIEPETVSVNSNMVYTTHAGFVTYAGPAPASIKEKGWLVQVETDFNRDNVPDVITRYNHLVPDALTVFDVSYRRETFTAETYINYGRSIPFGNGPYVTRNQLIGYVGDSGSPGNFHIQYEIVTSRFESSPDRGLSNAGLDRFNCYDDPYIETCYADESRPGVFFSINHKKPDVVKSAVYVNPGLVTPIPAKNPKIRDVQRARTPELPEPGLPAPDFLPPPPPITIVPTPKPEPPSTPVVAGCTSTDPQGRAVQIDGDGYLRIFDQNNCEGHWQVLYSEGCSCACGISPIIITDPCPIPGDPNRVCERGSTKPYYGGPMCWAEGCVGCTKIGVFFDSTGPNSCPQGIVEAVCPK